ncbi:MAG: metalloregulator ArsR/SmtB family transcription factor [Archangium sp.]
MKRRVFDELARVGAALSSAGRLQLLEVLAQGERTVEVLAHETGLSIANCSHHLKVLRDAGLVTSQKLGLHVVCRLAGDEVDALLRQVRLVGERHAPRVKDAAAQHGAHDPQPTISRPELDARARSGSVTVIDVRPVEEFAAGHVAGALSIPLDELEARLTEVPARAPVVVYCRSAHSTLAFEAVELLRIHGRRATRLEGGFPDWRADGLQVGSQ